MTHDCLFVLPITIPAFLVFRTNFTQEQCNKLLVYFPRERLLQLGILYRLKPPNQGERNLTKINSWIKQKWLTKIILVRINWWLITLLCVLPPWKIQNGGNLLTTSRPPALFPQTLSVDFRHCSSFIFALRVSAAARRCSVLACSSQQLNSYYTTFPDFATKIPLPSTLISRQMSVLWWLWWQRRLVWWWCFSHFCLRRCWCKHNFRFVDQTRLLYLLCVQASMASAFCSSGFWNKIKVYKRRHDTALPAW